MGLIEFNEAIVHGNFAKLKRKKPKNWVDKDYKILIPFDFKWREKIGKVTCTCKEIEEHYMPYYGFTWYHTEECELIKLITKRPQLMNLQCYSHLPLLAQTD